MARTPLNRLLRQLRLASLVLLALGYIVALVLFFPATIFAQSEKVPVTAAWSLPQAPAEGWTIGDRIPLYLTVTYPANGRVTVPALPEMWGSFEVREQRPSKPVDHGEETLSVVSERTVTLWTPGEHQTPRFAVHFRDANDQLHEVAVPPLTISVASVLEDGDTEKRDLKPQASLPHPSVWPWILGTGFAAVSATVAGWALLARLGRRTTPAVSLVHLPDSRPAHTIAYGELDRIAALELPASGEMKQHYTLVANCIREYIHARYGVPAMDQTTEESAAALRQLPVDRIHSDLLCHLLVEADLVKFSEFLPSLGQAGAAIKQARHIVDLTRVDAMEGEQTDWSEKALRGSSHDDT